MKPEQDTPTREYTWLETNSSETDQVLDKWWETNDGRHAKVHRRKSQPPPQSTKETTKLGYNLVNTLRETHDERQVKAKNRRPESRAPPARLGDKWTGRQPERRTPPGKRRTPLKKVITNHIVWFVVQFFTRPSYSVRRGGFRNTRTNTMQERRPQRHNSHEYILFSFRWLMLTHEKDRRVNDHYVSRILLWRDFFSVVFFFRRFVVASFSAFLFFELVYPKPSLNKSLYSSGTKPK
jgi:hypothetical protein